MEFAKRLRKVRKDRDMTQAELARRLNVDDRTIGGWEAGYRQPSLEVLKKISEILECDARYLLGIIDYFD